MCCLRYEHETYERESARTPRVGSRVMTKDGQGTVTDANVLTGLLKVKFTDEKGDSFKVYDRDSVKILGKKE